MSDLKAGEGAPRVDLSDGGGRLGVVGDGIS